MLIPFTEMCGETPRLASLSRVREMRKGLIISGSNPRPGCVKKRDASALVLAYLFFSLPFLASSRRVFVLLFAVRDVPVKMDARGKVHGIDYRSQ